VIEAAVDGSWDGWRDRARRLLADGVPPARIAWVAAGAEPALPLFAADGDGRGDGDPGGAAEGEQRAATALRVPRRFVELGEAVACHREAARWAVLYRVLWRLIAGGERRLLDVDVDPDVHALLRMERDVRRASHKMKAFVRFRATGGDRDPFVAWFEPEQSVVERVAPFFARRFAGMRWSILTPDRCAHWDLRELTFTEGVARNTGPGGDSLEDLWRTYYARIFNPARVNVRAMSAEMPQVYWKNLPEAELIRALTREASGRMARMVEGRSDAASEPALRVRRT